MTRSQYKVETYPLLASNGRLIRIATRVTRVSDGAHMLLTERVSKKSAIQTFEALQPKESYDPR